MRDAAVLAYEMAGHAVIIADLAQPGFFGVTARFGIRAAAGEAAAGGQIDRARRVALQKRRGLAKICAPGIIVAMPDCTAGLKWRDTWVVPQTSVPPACAAASPAVGTSAANIITNRATCATIWFKPIG